VTVQNALPNPTANPVVKSSGVDQFNELTGASANTFIGSNIAAIQNFHDEDESGGWGAYIDDSVQNQDTQLRYAPVGDEARAAKAKAVAALNAKAAAAPAKRAVAPQPDVRVWTSGTFATDRAKTEGAPNMSRASLQAMIVGFDTRISGSFRAGVSFGGQLGESKFDQLGSKQQSQVLMASTYGSLEVAEKLFVDGVLGYGGARFKSTRYDSSASGLLKGTREGDMLFGALRVSLWRKLGQWQYAPFARFDVIQATLKKYAEQGDPAWTLAFDKATASSQALVLGLMSQYDIVQGRSVVSPTLRIEYRHGFNGDVNQSIAYTSDPGTRYNLAIDGSKRDTITGAIGLKARGEGNLSGQIEYSAGMSTQGGGFAGQGLRGTIRLGF
jgi:hypothetical protein